MYDSPPKYQTYILKCWQERSEGEESTLIVRFSLEETTTQVRYGFKSLEEMTNFLQQQCVEENHSSD